MAEPVAHKSCWCISLCFMCCYCGRSDFGKFVLCSCILPLHAHTFDMQYAHGSHLVGWDKERGRERQRCRARVTRQHSGICNTAVCCLVLPAAPLYTAWLHLPLIAHTTCSHCYLDTRG